MTMRSIFSVGVVLVCALVLMSAAGPVDASHVCSDPSGAPLGGDCNTLGHSGVEFTSPAGGSLFGALCLVIAWLGGFGAIIAFVMIVWAGYLFMTAGGKAPQIATAKRVLVYSLVGFVLLLFARSAPLIFASMAGIDSSQLPDECTS